MNISKYHLNWKLFEKTKLSFKKKSRKDTRRLLEDLWWGIKFSEKKSGKKFCQNWWGKPRKSRRILFSKIFDHPNSVRTLLHSTFFGKFLVQCCCCFVFLISSRTICEFLCYMFSEIYIKLYAIQLSRNLIFSSNSGFLSIGKVCNSVDLRRSCLYNPKGNATPSRNINP